VDAYGPITNRLLDSPRGETGIRESEGD